MQCAEFTSPFHRIQPFAPSSHSVAWKPWIWNWDELLRAKQKISFGGIPNSSGIHKYICNYMYVCESLCHVWLHGYHYFAQWLCPYGQCHHQKVFKTITWLFLSSLQGNKPHWNPPQPSDPCLRNLHQHAPENVHQHTLQLSKPSGTCLRNLHTGTLQNRNLPLEPSEIFRNLPDSGTCLRNLLQHTPKPSGTFLRNLLLPPAPANTGAYIWAEDPISLRCWGKNCSRMKKVFDPLPNWLRDM